MSVPEAMEDLLAMKRLWVHEVLRVYYDRLVDDIDRSWIVEALREVTFNQLEENFDSMFERLASPGSTTVIRGVFESFFYLFRVLDWRDRVKEFVVL